MTLREQILTADDLTSETLTIPEWNNAILEIRSISQGARARLLRDTDGAKDVEKFGAMLLIATVCDPLNHQPIFTAPDLDALNQKSVKAIESVLTVAMRVCGFSEAESLEKKSDRTVSAESPSV